MICVTVDLYMVCCGLFCGCVLSICKDKLIHTDIDWASSLSRRGKRKSNKINHWFYGSSSPLTQCTAGSDCFWIVVILLTIYLLIGFNFGCTLWDLYCFIQWSNHKQACIVLLGYCWTKTNNCQFLDYRHSLAMLCYCITCLSLVFLSLYMPSWHCVSRWFQSQ